ncbi:4800_t:CDS:2, partial [Acaulospora colombiana]
FISREADPLVSSMLKATKNDNKKKGYKQDTEAISHSHFVFDATTLNPSQRPTSSLSFRRLIPPSQRTDLPSNMFVTSVDVEAGEWDSQYLPDSTLATITRPTQLNGGIEILEDKGAFVATQRETTSGDHHRHPSFNWGEMERKWDEYGVVSGIKDIAPGNVLLWRELALHPVKFTPELMIYAGRIASVDDKSATLELIPRDDMHMDLGADANMENLEPAKHQSATGANSSTRMNIQGNRVNKELELYVTEDLSKIPEASSTLSLTSSLQS